MCKILEIGMKWSKSRNLFVKLAGKLLTGISVCYAKSVEAEAEKHAAGMPDPQELDDQMGEEILAGIYRTLNERGRSC